MAKTIGPQRFANMTHWLHKHFGTPIYFSGWPLAQPLADSKSDSAAVNNSEQSPRTVVYVPSCANRIFASEQRSVQDVFASLCAKAGYRLVIPTNLVDLCCGMPWHSKGLTSIGDTKQQQWQAAIAQVSENGKWPVVTDASPCARNSQLVEGIEVKIGAEEVDDNLIIPIVAAIAIWSIRYFF